MTATANSLNKEFGYIVASAIIGWMPLYLLSRVRYKNKWTCHYLFNDVTYILITSYFLYRSKLKEHMQYCVDHPEEISKIAKVKAQVSEVKGVMMENIEKVKEVFLPTP